MEVGISGSGGEAGEGEASTTEIPLKLASVATKEMSPGVGVNADLTHKYLCACCVCAGV